MASVTFSRKEFEKEIKLTKDIEEKINLFGTHLESLTDDKIELEILPNRPDLLSLRGFLRSFKLFISKNADIPKYTLHKPENNFVVKISPNVQPIRPFTACAIVKNLKLDDEKIKEIIDLQEKIHATLGRKRKKIAVGIYPLEKIQLPISYDALPPSKIIFVPLDEEKEMNGLQILQSTATGKEHAYLLEKSEKFPVFLDGKSKILSMPPIINSDETGKVTTETKEVFIECSGADFEILNKTLVILVTTLAEIGGKVYQMELRYENEKIVTPNLSTRNIKISLATVNKTLGLNLKEKDLEQLLPRMGLEYKNNLVKIPSWRNDIMHEVDVIEDIAIAYGYEKLNSEIPQSSTYGQESQKSKSIDAVAEILSGLQLLEVSSYHLVKESEINVKTENALEVENSKTEYKYLRPNLFVPALRILSENKDKGYPQELFEIGTVFSADKKSETGIKEKEHCIIACSPANFTRMKQILSYVFEQLNKKYELAEIKNPFLIDGRTGTIQYNGKSIGIIGEVHPETLNAWGIKMPVAIIEFSLDEIIF